MQTIHRNPDERGSAILMVLGILSVVLILAMVFAVTSRNAQIVADAKADQVQANLVSQSTATSVEQTLSLFQNKGNLLGASGATALKNAIPDEMEIDQSMSTLDSSLFYGDKDNPDPDFLGLQPYVGYVDATNKWNALCLYGELSPSDKANAPFGIDYGDGSEEYYKRSYQSLYYTHRDDSYNEVTAEGDNSLYEIIKRTRLGKAYIQATGGTETDDSSSQFAALLNGDTAHQLQFKNVTFKYPDEAEEHVVSRYGFVAFSEGSKFDINQLVAPDFEGDDAYVPCVEGGLKLIADEGTDAEIAHDGIDVNVGTSTYAVMGYTYDDNVVDELKDEGYITETETVQYGIHPQELQTRTVSGNAIYKDNLECGVADKPSRWFNYDMLTENSTIGTEFKEKDLFVYGVASGTEDKELRFNGQYVSEDELQDELLKDVDSSMDSITSSQSNFLKKANIAYPWGLYCNQGTCDIANNEDITWDKISEKMRDAADLTEVKSLTEHFFKKHLGLNYDSSSSDHYLFKKGSTDLTPAVFANMVDFCDSDNAVTALDGDKNRIKFTDTISQIKNPSFCSNERVPAIVGVNVAMELDKNGTTFSFVKDLANAMSSIHNTYRIGIRPGTITFTPRVTLSVQNFFNEELENTKQKYRVIVEGRITPFILAQKINYYLDSSNDLRYKCTNGLIFLNQSSTNNSCFLPELTIENSIESNNYGLNPASPNTTIIDQMVQNSNCINFSIDKTTDQITRTFGELENQTIEIECNNIVFNNTSSPVYTNNPTGLPTIILADSNNPNKIYYRFTGTGYALKVDKIMVMGQDSGIGNDEISEIMYAEDKNPSSLVESNGKSKISYIYQSYEKDNSSDNGTTLFFYNPSNDPYNQLVNWSTVDGVTCNDPRMNHDFKQWTWYNECTNHPFTGNNFLYGDNITVTVDSNLTCNNCIQIKNNSLDLPVNEKWPHGALPKVALATVEEAMKNESSADTVKKDWEPDFEPGDMSVTAVTDGDDEYCKSTMDTTLSTFFIPNYPFTSLWQLGAVHRGTSGQTLNLKKFGTNASGEISHEYEDGDAWLLDYLCLNELSNDGGIRGKFNPNCFNAPAYRFLFANIPANPDAEDTMIYANGKLDPSKSANKVKRNDYFADYVDESWNNTTEDLEETTFRFRIPGSGQWTSAHDCDYDDVTDVMKAQSWSPVQAFFNFIDVDGGTSSKRTSPSATFTCNDRQAESLIGCTAGIMSTRYETYTVIAVGQSVKWIDIPDPDHAPNEVVEAITKQFANPVQLGGTGNANWYSILSTEVRLVTLLRDCWFGKITVLKSQIL